MLALTLFLLFASSTWSLRFDTRGTDIIDELGRVRQFHGINSVKKEAPWVPFVISNEFQRHLLSSMGINFVRLGLMWSGVQPSADFFNSSYVSIIKEGIHELARSNISVILDLHQDVGSSLFCSYDGFPLWLVQQMNFSRAFPYPLNGTCVDHDWFAFYFAESTGQFFQALYDNKFGIQDRFVDFWNYVAKEFADVPNVVGFELLNEPWCGDYISRPDLLVPGIAGALNLEPLYKRTITAIRSVDPSRLVLIEPMTWAGVFGPTVQLLSTGFDKALSDRTILSVHYYCWMFHQHDSGYDFKTRAACDGLLGPKSFSDFQKDGSALQVPVMLTEFGLCRPKVNRTDQDGSVECESVLDNSQRHHISWVYWDVADQPWNPEVDDVSIFARPYATAVGGRIKEEWFDVKAKGYHIAFIPSSIDVETEIFLASMWHYQGGYDVRTSGNVKHRTEGQYLVVSVQDLTEAFIEVYPIL